MCVLKSAVYNQERVMMARVQMNLLDEVLLKCDLGFAMGVYLKA